MLIKQLSGLTPKQIKLVVVFHQEAETVNGLNALLKEGWRILDCEKVRTGLRLSYCFLLAEKI